MSKDDEDTDLTPPGWFVALVGGISGAISALVFERGLFVGLGTGVGVALFYLLYVGWYRVQGGQSQGMVEGPAA